MFGNNDNDDETERTYDWEPKQWDFTAHDPDSHSVTLWSLGDHTKAPEYLTVEDLDNEAQNQDGLDVSDVLKDASDRLDTGASMSSFECSVCGLRHGHSDNKHDIRSAFNFSREFVESTLYSPFCHCGVNEAAMLVDFFHHIAEQGVVMFSDQHNFEGVLEVDPETVATIREEMREESLPVHEAIESTDVDIPEDLYDEVNQFLQRVLDIKSAAESAPIASATRGDIDATRRRLRDRFDISDSDSTLDEF